MQVTQHDGSPIYACLTTESVAQDCEEFQPSYQTDDELPLGKQLREADVFEDEPIVHKDLTWSDRLVIYRAAKEACKKPVKLVKLATESVIVRVSSQSDFESCGKLFADSVNVHVAF